jgi:hypothetical protein
LAVKLGKKKGYAEEQSIGNTTMIHMNDVANLSRIVRKDTYTQICTPILISYNDFIIHSILRPIIIIIII